MNNIDLVRNMRNILIHESDWTQLDDCALSEEKKEEWRIYRQKLRDITIGFDESKPCKWPEKPQ